MVLCYFAALVLLLGAVVWSYRGPLTEKTDFSVTYIGSRIVHDGNGAKLYDLQEQERVRSSLLRNAEPLIYEHPPFEAFLLSPLGGLPYRTAYLIWGCINVLIWLSLPLLLRPYFPAPEDEVSYLVLWLLFAPLGIALYQGQSSLLLVLLYAVAFIQLVHGREFSAGIFVGLGLFKFQFVIPFALIFVLRRKWKFVAGFGISTTLLAGISFLAVGTEGVIGYVKLLRAVASNPINRSYGASVDMATVQGLVQSLLTGVTTPAIVGFLVAVLSLGLIGLAAWRWNVAEQKDPRQSLDLLFAAAVVVSLVTGFHMFTHDLSPMILAMMLAYRSVQRSSQAVRRALIIFLIVLWIPVTYFALIAGHCMYLLCPVLLLFTGALWIAQTRIKQMSESSVAEAQ